MGERFTRRARAEARAIPGLRSATVAYARTAGADEELAGSIRLAVSEALTNAVVHAYRSAQPGEMHVEAWRDADDHLVIRISDDGNGLVPSPGSPGLGLGIGLMAQMADDFSVTNREATPGTIVTLRFALGPPARRPARCGR